MEPHAVLQAAEEVVTGVGEAIRHEEARTVDQGAEDTVQEEEACEAHHHQVGTETDVVALRPAFQWQVGPWAAGLLHPDIIITITDKVHRQGAKAPLMQTEEHRQTRLCR